MECFIIGESFHISFASLLYCILLQHQIAEHEIQNISFASQDSLDLSTFAYVTHDNKTGNHYCHVFRVTTMVSEV